MALGSHPGPGGGMADTTDSKSVARKGVRVQVPHPGTSSLQVSRNDSRSSTTADAPPASALADAIFSAERR